MVELSAQALGILREVGLDLDEGPPQIGIVVADLDAAVAGAEALGVMGSFRKHTISSADFSRIEHRGGPADLSFRVALNRERPQVEFIQPLSGESVYREFLDAHGPGLHHLGFVVPDIATIEEKLAGLGFDAPFHGGGLGDIEDGGFAYFDTTAPLGFWLELIEHPPAGR